MKRFLFLFLLLLALIMGCRTEAQQGGSRPPVSGGGVSLSTVRTEVANATNSLGYAIGGTNLIILTPDMSQAAISNAFRAAPSGATIQFRGRFTGLAPQLSGSYLANSNVAVALLKLNSHTNTTVEGVNGAEIVINSTGGNLFELRDCDSVTIRNLKVRWVNHPRAPSNEFSVVFGYHRSRNLTFEKLWVENFHNHAINEQIVPLRESSNTVVRGCTFISGGITNWNGTYPNTDGSAVQVDSYTRVEDCFFANMPRGVEIEGAQGNGAQFRPIIQRNVFSNVYEYAVFNITTNKGSGLIVRDNLFMQRGDPPPSWNPFGIYINAGRGAIIEGNTFEGLSHPVNLTAGAGGIGSVLIRGNVFRTNINGIFMSQTYGAITGVVINANVFEAATNGIVADGDSISITDNVLLDSGDGSSAVAAIALKKNGASGSGNMQVTGNTIIDGRGSSAMYYGVQIYSGVTNCLVHGNYIKGHRYGTTTNKGVDNLVIDRPDLERVFGSPTILLTTNSAGTNHLLRVMAVNGTMGMTINSNAAIEFRNAVYPPAKTNIYLRMVSDQAYGTVGQDAYVVPNSGNPIIGSRLATYFRPGTTTNGAQILELGTGVSGSVIRPAVFVSNGKVGFLTNDPIAVVTAVSDSAAVVSVGAFAFSGATTNVIQVYDSAGQVRWAVSATGDIVHNITNNIRTVIGAGSPEGVISAGVGSEYRRTDGAAGSWRYSKTNGTGNTGWHPYF